MKIIRNSFNHFKSLFTNPETYFKMSQKSILYNFILFALISIIITLANFFIWNNKYLSKYTSQAVSEIKSKLAIYPSDLILSLKDYRLSIFYQDVEIDHTSLTLDHLNNQPKLYFIKNITMSIENFYEKNSQTAFLFTSNQILLDLSSIHSPANNRTIIELSYNQLPFLKNNSNLVINQNFIKNNQKKILSYVKQDFKMILQASTILAFLAFQIVNLLYELPLILLIYLFFKITNEEMNLKQLINIFINITIVTSCLDFLINIIYQNSDFRLIINNFDIIIFTYLWLYYRLSRKIKYQNINSD